MSAWDGEGQEKRIERREKKTKLKMEGKMKRREEWMIRTIRAGGG